MAKARKPRADETNGDAPELPPVVGGDGLTTGRFIVVFKDEAVGDPAAARAVMSNVAGIGDMAVASDYEDSAVSADDLAQTDAMYFPTLGVAVVSGDEAVQALSAGTADADSPILAIEPEYIAHALETSGAVQLDFLRGYKAAVDHLFERLTAGAAEAALDIMPAAGFVDTAQFTWGLQATRVNTSRYSGQGVRVAVLDTGFDFQHPDFQGRAIVSRSFISGQAVQDGQGHGTHCTGTACGPRQPASGVRRYGVAYGAAIYIGKVLSNQGSGATGGIIAGIEWAVRNGCQVVSMSLGADINQKVQQYEVPIQRALNAGTLVVAAASNNASRPGNVGFVGAPANADAALAVAALDSQLRIANFSPRSSTVTGVGGKVDIAGPGVNVFSSVPVARGRHAFFNGTSMATPHVAGIAALWCQATGARGAALWARLQQSARALALDSRDVGAGLVQAPQ